MNTTVRNARTLRVNDFNESGKLLSYTIKNYLKLPELVNEQTNQNVHYRGVCDLVVEVEGHEPVTYKGVKVSSLLAYQIEKNSEKFLDVKFTSYNTSSDYWENPLRFNISEDNQHFNLSLVNERGVTNVTVNLPGGSSEVVKKFLYFTPDRFLRYYQKRTSTREEQN